MRMRHMLPWLALGLVAAAPPARHSPVTAELAIGKSIDKNMPVDTASAFPADVGSVVAWSRVTDAEAGTKITHVWIHGDDTSKVELNIGGSPWRTYSRKTLGENGTGDWKVEVLDAAGTVLATKSFKVGG
jgi:Protein of unknown function (DUF2914)